MPALHGAMHINVLSSDSDVQVVSDESSILVSSASSEVVPVIQAQTSPQVNFEMFQERKTYSYSFHLGGFRISKI